VDLCKNGIPTNHAPKTMDLDLQTYSVGGDSTINKVAQAIEDLRTTARSHNRIIIFETFGRYVGHSAFRGGVAGDADCIVIPEIAPDFDIIYNHMKERFMKRVLYSDVHAGSYIIVTAEAMKGSKGDDINEEGFLIDKNSKPDAFGHYKLAGAGKKIEKELTERMKKDPEIKEFMIKAKMYVPEQYEIPEIRVIQPTHMMRAGHSSAYDVNFGREAGSGAVLLLSKGISGMTIAGVVSGEIKYIPTVDAIKQKAVDLKQVALYEIQGMCFGRKPEHLEPSFKKIEIKDLPRHL
jgi:6-phosphofructokinase 1